jgi:Mn2+/Fe2+ NRAMP family transporter
LLASAILAVPVIASTTAYVAAHTFGWTGSLSASYRDAKALYRVLIAALALAALLAFSPISSIAMLYGASMAGGLATPLTLAFPVLVATSRTIMETRRAGRPAAVLGWAVTAAVTVAGAASVIAALKFS